MNGVLTFDQGVSGYVSTPFPLNYALIAIFWVDIDIRESGQTYIRQVSTRDASTEAEFQTIDNVIGSIECGGFTSTWLYVASFVNVGFYGSNVYKVSHILSTCS